MEQERKVRATTTIKTEVAKGPNQERELSRQLELFAITMARELATSSSEIEQKLPNGDIWKMRLVKANSSDVPLLRVDFPNHEIGFCYFRPLTRENWPSFASNVKQYDLATEVRDRIPELARVSFKARVVKFPPDLDLENNPILIGCTNWGGFLPAIETLPMILDAYYPHKEVLTETQPA